MFWNDVKVVCGAVCRECAVRAEWSEEVGSCDERSAEAIFAAPIEVRVFIDCAKNRFVVDFVEHEIPLHRVDDSSQQTHWISSVDWSLISGIQTFLNKKWIFYSFVSSIWWKPNRICCRRPNRWVIRRKFCNISAKCLALWAQSTNEWKLWKHWKPWQQWNSQPVDPSNLICIFGITCASIDGLAFGTRLLCKPKALNNTKHFSFHSNITFDWLICFGNNFSIFFAFKLNQISLHLQSKTVVKSFEYRLKFYAKSRFASENSFRVYLCFWVSY